MLHSRKKMAGNKVGCRLTNADILQGKDMTAAFLSCQLRGTEAESLCAPVCGVFCIMITPLCFADMLPVSAQDMGFSLFD